MITAPKAFDAVLRIGEVVAVEGRRAFLLVDRRKNLSHMFLDGELLTNVGVNSYIAIRKGFLSIIGRVEGERIEDDFAKRDVMSQREPVHRSRRILTVSLAGHIDDGGRYASGTRELPLIGNEGFLLTRAELHRVHDMAAPEALSVCVSTLYGDSLPLRLPVDGLFNSHIAIFGNTGSGKSNTLAALYQALTEALRARNEHAYRANARFVLFDFNSEYIADGCIAPDKTVYSLSTRRSDGGRLPLPAEALLELEVLAILTDATEKTQKPFLGRALRLLRSIRSADSAQVYYAAILRKRIREILSMADKVRAYLLLDYVRELLPRENDEGHDVELTADIDWHNATSQFMLKTGGASRFFQSEPQLAEQTVLHDQAGLAPFGDDLIADVIRVLYLQLISDVLANRAVNEHVAPVIFRLVKKQQDIGRMFSLSDDAEFWSSNFVVVDLGDVNLEMRKTIPLLLSKRLYHEQRGSNQGRTLTLIIDEAHNILSTESFREAESWKDYRLETFEEIIKEGRKFGVFVTIASQRPSDISQTISSQAHNYFIHRLINDQDLKTIAGAISYIDRDTEMSIPTLATGTCVFSGVITPMPLKMNVRALADLARPDSATRQFSTVVPEQYD